MWIIVPAVKQQLAVQSDPATNSDPFVLVLENVTLEDDGWYTCLVGNSVGYAHEFFWLTVIPRTASTSACTVVSLRLLLSKFTVV